DEVPPEFRLYMDKKKPVDNTTM
ncbi:hypothetical protein KIPB_006035, partial [Kipferlia bialata]